MKVWDKKVIHTHHTRTHPPIYIYIYIYIISNTFPSLISLSSVHLDEGPGGDVRVGHGARRVVQAAEMLFEVKHTALVHAHALPYGIAALG